jgi:hypothetical protein
MISGSTVSLGSGIVTENGGLGGTYSDCNWIGVCSGGTGGVGIIAVHGTVTGTTSPTYTAF